MKANRINPNLTEVAGDRVTVLFSYATPVAAHVQGEGYYRTETRHSVTTSRHINTWLAANAGIAWQTLVKERPQAWFNALDFSTKDADAYVALSDRMDADKAAK